GGAGIGGGIDISFDRGAPIPLKATLTHVTLTHNQARGGPGGSGAPGGDGWGGGLSVGAGFLFVGSDPPSGRPDTTVVRLSESVLSNTLALGGDGESGGNGFGGGILVGRGASLSVSTSTITKNHANGGSGSGGDSDGLGIGGGVYSLGTFAFDGFTVISEN